MMSFFFFNLFIYINLFIFSLFIITLAWTILDQENEILPKRYSTSKTFFNVAAIIMLGWFFLVGMIFSIRGLFFL